MRAQFGGGPAAGGSPASRRNQGSVESMPSEPAPSRIPDRLPEPTTVEEVERQIPLLVSEIYRSCTNALSAFHSFKGFEAALDEGLPMERLAAVNKTPTFWISVRQGWYAATILGMGRAYDRRPDVVTPANLLKMCRRFLGAFSRERLRERVFRRQPNNPDAAAQADEFVADYCEIRSADFDGVERELRSAERLYQDKVEMLRHAQAHSPEWRLVAPKSWEVEWGDARKLLEIPLAVTLGIQDSFNNGYPVALAPIDGELEKHCLDQARRIVLCLR